TEWKSFLDKAREQHNSGSKDHVQPLYKLEAFIRARQKDLLSGKWELLINNQQENIRSLYDERIELVRKYLRDPQWKTYQEIFDRSKRLRQAYVDAVESL